MKKILLLTNIFPLPNITFQNSTSVCLYYAKEWVKQGYTVEVIYNYNIYLPFFYWLIPLFKQKLGSLFPTIINAKRITKNTSYTIDGIKVNLIPCFKPFPMGKFSKKTINKQSQEIQNVLINEQFSPDVVIGHFLYPNIEIIPILCKKLKVPSALVLHGKIKSLLEKDKKHLKNLFDNIDIMGFRSLPIKQSFEKVFGKHPDSFICCSGIPENFIDNVKKKNWITDKFNYTYVGALIKRKNPVTVINSLLNVHDDNDFSLTYVGDGDEKKKIEKIINKHHLKNCKLLGFIPREKVSEVLDETHCFIMVSRDETFGLVYLEAMGKGCITIASKNEGMDGIIIDGFNGFLCEAGNENELTEKIKHIESLSPEELSKISHNAIQTAKRYTDSDVAKNYINTIEDFISNKKD